MQTPNKDDKIQALRAITIWQQWMKLAHLYHYIR